MKDIFIWVINIGILAYLALLIYSIFGKKCFALMRRYSYYDNKNMYFQIVFSYIIILTVLAYIRITVFN